MRRFILQQNIEGFESLLIGETKLGERAWLLKSIAAWKRELAIVIAASQGAYPSRAPPGSASERTVRSQFAHALHASGGLQLLLDPGPGLHIVDVSEAYAEATLTSPTKVAGEALFNVFPDNPDQPLADGVSKLFASLRKAARTGQVNRMAVQRYDVRDADGQFVERHWLPVNTPLFDLDGRLVYIMHDVRDVTEDVVVRRRVGNADEVVWKAGDSAQA